MHHGHFHQVSVTHRDRKFQFLIPVDRKPVYALRGPVTCTCFVPKIRGEGNYIKGAVVIKVYN